MDAISAEGAAAIVARIASLMEENRNRLIALDQVIGDGDLGLTMANGFAAAAGEAGACGEKEPGRVFMRAGMAINKAAPSTMGTLMATGFMRGGKAVSGKETLAPADMRIFFRAFLDGIVERGRAKPGDKTIVDSILPAAEAIEADPGRSLAETLKAGLAGALDGQEKAKDFMSQHGKAAVFREKTKGLEDPGCAAFCLVIRGFAEAVLE